MLFIIIYKFIIYNLLYFVIIKFSIRRQQLPMWLSICCVVESMQIVLSPP